MSTTIDRLEQLDAAATPAPWIAIGYRVRANPETDTDSGITTWYVPALSDGPADAELIAATRNALPALLRVARAARACADDLATELQARYAGTLHAPTMHADYQRDMAPVETLRAALNALNEVKL